MKLLILGGTIFVGRHLVYSALANGHEVTLFNRGQRHPELFPNLEQLRGDRDGDLSALEGREWDAVLDPSAYVPRIASASATLLAKATKHYTFISSISAYASFATPGLNESSPLATLKDETVEQVTGETYGGLKVLCEKAVEAAMPGKTLIIRPGYIVGPDDPTDRFAYWVHRVAKGGEMLAPGAPQNPIQVIDVRDLTDWTISLVEQYQTGIYNATGPDYELTLGQLLDTSKEVSGQDTKITWMDVEFLGQHDIKPGLQLPIWTPDTEDYAGFAKVDCSKAFAAGLTFRPLAEIVQATLDWDNARSQENAWKGTIKPDHEAQVLEAWHNR